MVKKEFFCRLHHAEAKVSAKKETAMHHKFHKSQEADRKEQKKRPE
jgi:hypothetical protein